MTIGVLALQGDVREHLAALERCEVEGVTVRTVDELNEVEGLIIPGGESTTIGKLMERYGLLEATQQRAQQGMPIYGTCAGMILLAKDIVGSEQTRLGLMDIAVERNAYGRQIDSFEADLTVRGLGDLPVRGVFIRAPIVRRIAVGVEVLAEYEGVPVLVRQGNLLAGSFHPELADEVRVHRYFLSCCGRQ